MPEEIKNLIASAIGLVYPNLIKKSEDNRIATHKMFRHFYEYNKTEIEGYLRTELLAKKIFKKSTLDKLIFGHMNIIKKVLNRKVGGIYTNDPIRFLKKGEEKQKIGEQEYKKIIYDENFDKALAKSKYHKRMKELLRKGIFFNYALIMPAFRDGQMHNDVYTPDQFIVVAKANDYLQIEALIIQKFDNIQGQYYFTFWSSEEHYILDYNFNKLPIPGNEKGKQPLKNPLGKIPVSIFRLDEGSDHYGEPNWALLENQKLVNILLSSFTRTQLYQAFAILFGKNTNFAENTNIDPGQFLQSKSDDGGNVDSSKQIDLKYVSSELDLETIRNNIDWVIDKAMTLEGIPASSASVSGEAPKQISVKTIDEKEIEEVKDDLKLIMYDTEIEAMENYRLVHNFHVKNGDLKAEKLDEKGEIGIIFSEERMIESVEDKTKRRESEKQYGIKDEIDFIQEDLEITEIEAVEHYQQRISRMEALKPASKSNNNPDNAEINK